MLSLNCFGIGKYEEGQLLYVWAKSGLKFREKPEFNSEVLANIPFGSEVVVMIHKDYEIYLHSSMKIQNKVEVEGGKTQKIEMKGSWARIKVTKMSLTPHGTQTGCGRQGSDQCHKGRTPNHEWDQSHEQRHGCSSRFKLNQ